MILKSSISVQVMPLRGVPTAVAYRDSFFIVGGNSENIYRFEDCSFNTIHTVRICFRYEPETESWTKLVGSLSRATDLVAAAIVTTENFPDCEKNPT